MLAHFLNRPLRPSHRRSCPRSQSQPPAHRTGPSSSSRTQLPSVIPIPIPTVLLINQSNPSEPVYSSISQFYRNCEPTPESCHISWTPTRNNLPLATTSRMSRITKSTSTKSRSKLKTSIVITQKKSSFQVSYPREPLENYDISKTIVGISSRTAKDKNPPSTTTSTKVTKSQPVRSTSRTSFGAPVSSSNPTESSKNTIGSNAALAPIVQTDPISNQPTLSPPPGSVPLRSEERRVGKECR